MDVLSRKAFAVTLLLLVMMVATGTQVLANTHKPFDGVVVDALIFRSLDTDYIIEVLAPRLKEETGITLRVDQVPYEEVRAKQIADSIGAKRYDIINPCTEWCYEYRTFATPLNEWIGRPGYPDLEVEDIIPFVWQGFNPDEEIWWLPYQPDTRIFFYRDDLLKAEGLEVPRTWDELLYVAERLTKDTDGDGVVDQFGFGFPGIRGWNLTLAWVPLMFAAGGEMWDENLQPVFNGPAGVEALEFMLELKKFAPPDVTNYGEYELIQAAMNGTVAMGISATSITPEIEAANSPVKGLIKSAMFPIKSEDIDRKYNAILGGWAFGVSSYSTKKDAAAYVAMWLASKDISNEMEMNGRLHPARASAANNPEFLERNPHVPTIIDILSGSVLFFPGPESSLLGETINVHIARAISGEVSPQQALDQAAEEVKALLASAGY